MAAVIPIALNVLPGLGKTVRRCLSNQSPVVYDWAMKFGSVYVPTIYSVLVVMTVTNQYLRESPLDCVEGDNIPSLQLDHRRLYDLKLNDFCFNYETFTVSKAMNSSRRGDVIFPGIDRHDVLVDNIRTQKYYKFSWLPLIILIGCAYLPHGFWKGNGYRTIGSLLAVSADNNQEDSMEKLVQKFLYIAGHNFYFGIQYMFCKVLAIIAPAVQMGICVSFFSREFMFYGFDTTVYFAGPDNVWPDSRDALFPRMAKCEWKQMGHGGSMEKRNAICQLTMNSLNQWVYLVVWFSIALSFMLNLLTCIYYITLMIPAVRRYQYSRYIKKIISDISVEEEVVCKQSQFSPVVNIEFGDWLVLYLLNQNIGECDFQYFMRELVVTKNRYLYMLFNGTVGEIEMLNGTSEQV